MPAGDPPTCPKCGILLYGFTPYCQNCGFGATFQYEIPQMPTSKTDWRTLLENLVKQIEHAQAYESTIPEQKFCNVCYRVTAHFYHGRWRDEGHADDCAYAAAKNALNE